MRYVYPCVLHPEEGGGFYVSFPDVRGALTSGKDRAEALAMAEDALVGALGAYYRLHQDIPLPSPIADGQDYVPVPHLRQPRWPCTGPCASRVLPTSPWPNASV